MSGNQAPVSRGTTLTVAAHVRGPIIGARYGLPRHFARYRRNFSAGGTYALYGGDLSLPGGLTIIGDGAESSYFQAGGTNRTPACLWSRAFLERPRGSP